MVKKRVGIEDFNEYFIVLLPAGEVLERARELQKIFAERYNLYQPGSYPGIHITLDRINAEYLEEADQIISEMSRSTEPFEIIIDDFTCYEKHGSHYFLVLRLKETESLRLFADKLHQQLQIRGISTVANYQEWEFHITLISNLFTHNPIPEREFENLCLMLSGAKTPCASKAEQIEVWKTDPDPAERCIKNYHLSR